MSMRVDKLAEPAWWAKRCRGIVRGLSGDEPGRCLAYAALASTCTHRPREEEIATTNDISWFGVAAVFAGRGMALFNKS